MKLSDEWVTGNWLNNCISKRSKCSAIHLIDKEKIRLLDDQNNSSKKDIYIQRSDL